MPTDKLRGRMDHYIRSMLDRADQVRRTEGIIYDQWDVMLMRYGCNRFYIEFGLPKVSIKTALVFPWIAFSKFERSCGSTNVVVTPYAGSVCASRL